MRARCGDVHAAEFRTTHERRYGLARIHQPRRIERGLEAMELLELGCRELAAHRIEFLDPDAVLAGDSAADADA